MTPPGTDSPWKAPLEATTDTCGKRRRTTDKSSNPDILGMLRSDTMTSGSSCFSFNRASNPSSAVATSYPSTARIIAKLLRTLGSSSTTNILCLQAGITPPGEMAIETGFARVGECHFQTLAINAVSPGRYSQCCSKL